MKSIIDISNEDWNKFLEENNISYKDWKKILNSKEFKLAAGDVVNLKSDIYFKDKSDIHGFGIFAKKDINKNDIIGIAGQLKNGKSQRSYLGRFTNHSNLKNIIFQKSSNGNIVAVCSKNIKTGKEILADYRDHIKFN